MNAAVRAFLSHLLPKRVTFAGTGAAASPLLKLSTVCTASSGNESPKSCASSSGSRVTLKSCVKTARVQCSEPTELVVVCPMCSPWHLFWTASMPHTRHASKMKPSLFKNYETVRGIPAKNSSETQEQSGCKASV